MHHFNDAGASHIEKSYLQNLPLHLDDDLRN